MASIHVPHLVKLAYGGKGISGAIDFNVSIRDGALKKDFFTLDTS
jgi:hypothetical protein